MSLISDVGTRVELVSMDPRCADISIALYRQDRADGPVGLLHTYSSKPEAADRIAFVARAMAVLGGLAHVEDALVRFPCETWHASAAKRAFLEACKVDPALPLATRPLETVDGGTGQALRVDRLGDGSYRVVAEGGGEGAASRAPEVAAGLAKLAELTVSDDPAVVSFPCGQDHDALIGLLLVRALNVRAVLREEEMTAARGILVAPSQQKQ